MRISEWKSLSEVIEPRNFGFCSEIHIQIPHSMYCTPKDPSAIAPENVMPDQYTVECCTD